jgi:hypothetical protein
MRRSREFEAFDRTMKTILRADPKAVKAAMEADKQANAAKRKAKKSPALGRASDAKGV